MNHRERLLATLRFEKVDRGLDYEFSAWAQTYSRWVNEGLPTDKDGKPPLLEEHFGTDDIIERTLWLQLRVGLVPEFEWKVLEDKGDTQIIQDEQGAVYEGLRPDLGASIPRYIRFAVQSRQDWERLAAEKLDVETPGRVPEDIEAAVEETRNRTGPAGFVCGSIYGWIRNWVGVENLSLALYDDPAWVEEMMEHLTRLTLGLLQKYAGKGLTLDMNAWWEDMCYRGGPLISPKHFRDLMAPRYKRITDFCRREFKCEFNQLDCDGRIDELVEPWLEAGINVMFPIEVLHTDAYALRERFGRRVLLRGGFDKRALIKGPRAIDAELARLRPLYEEGGFIPHTDHLVPPDVSFDNYCYYRRKKCELIGKPCDEQGRAVQTPSV